MLFLWTVYWGLPIKVMISLTLGGIVFHCYSDHDISGPVEAIGGVWTILLPSWSPIETIYFGKPGSACQRALVKQNPLTLIWLNGNWLYFVMYIYNDNIVDYCYYINNWIDFFSIFTYRITFTFIEACCISISHKKKKLKLLFLITWILQLLRSPLSYGAISFYEPISFLCNLPTVNTLKLDNDSNRLFRIY